MDDSSSVEAGQVGLEMKPMVYHQRPSQGEIDGAADYGRETFHNYRANSGWLRPSYTDPTRYDQVPLDNENRATDYNSNDSQPHDVAPTTGQMVELGGGVVAWTSTRQQSPRSSVSDDADRTCRGKETPAAPFRNSAGSETDNRSRRVSSADESLTSHDSVKSPLDGCGYWPGQGTEMSLLLDGRPDSDTILDSYQEPSNQNPRTYTALL